MLGWRYRLQDLPKQEHLPVWIRNHAVKYVNPNLSRTASKITSAIIA